ncbi:MAG: hypothetical protein NZ518_11865, partial [Dehalococcoidia bacterium]|nr:hypothetical protein [Dehalococcoidia bacterium]
TAAPGDTIELGVYWRVISPIGVRRNKRRDVTTVALIGPGGQTVATVDREPWGGIITTDRMLAGEVHFERYRFVIPPDAPPGPYRLDVGMYAYASKNRLGLIDETGQRTGGFLAPVATVHVAASGGE